MRVLPQTQPSGSRTMGDLPKVPGFTTVGEAANAVVSRLKLVLAARALVERDVRYDGPNIIIPTADHAEAIRLVRELRSALERAA